MTLITPAGKMDFDWSPVEKGLEKTASTDSKQKSDKDILFEAAQKIVKAQFSLGGEEAGDPCASSDKASSDAAPSSSSSAAASSDKAPSASSDSKIPASSDKATPPLPAEEAAAITPAGGSDAVKVVQELADKAQKADEVTTKVEEAVVKVEEAIQEVKNVVGSPAGAPPAADALPAAGVPSNGGEEAVEIEVEPEGGEEAIDQVEVEIVDDQNKPEDEIVQESCLGAAVKAKMTTVAEANDLVKTSKISVETRKKVFTYYRDYLKYDPEYCKLLVTDYEK